MMGLMYLIYVNHHMKSKILPKSNRTLCAQYPLLERILQPVSNDQK